MHLFDASLEIARWSYRHCRRLLVGKADHEAFLVRRYERMMGKTPNVQNPRTLTEKLIWLNVNYRHPLMPVLADKLLCRDEVARRLGPGALLPVLGVWNRAEDIDFDQLPNEFVLKISVGSGWNIFCRDKSKLNIPETIAKLNDWLGRHYYDLYREWPYENLRSRIFAEPFMTDAVHADRSPPDFKFYCFNGRPTYVSVCHDRRGARRLSFHDLEWNLAPFQNEGVARIDPPPTRPENLQELIEAAGRLSNGFPFVRVDLYSDEGQIRFGEMTWFPSAGHIHFEPADADAMLGNLLTLPNLQVARGDRETNRAA